jgi:site-specific DNA-methyltransferase (adenine-specific)
LVLDCFAGTGTTGAAALALGRRFVLGDRNREAIAVMRRRFRASKAEVAFLREGAGADAALRSVMSS